MNTPPISWSDLTLGCIEALTESHNLIESNPAAKDRHDAAIEILQRLAGDLDDLNGEVEEGTGEAYMIPSEIAGEHLNVYLASTATLSEEVANDTFDGIALDADGNIIN